MFNVPPWKVNVKVNVFMESQPQNPEFRNPENFYPWYKLLVIITYWSVDPVNV